ncbi:MAG: hypothetical protein ACRC18_06470 [Cetobacterium sp.]
MRKVKCRNCESKTPQDQAYLIVHVTKGGNEQKRYYCSEECYRKEQSEIFMLKQCQYFVDEVLGYVCINNEKNKLISEITEAGYTRKELYECMVSFKETILESLNYRQDIDKELHKIRYMFAIIKSNIKEFTDSNKQNVKEEKEVYEEIEIVKTNTPINTGKQSLWGRLGVK